MAISGQQRVSENESGNILLVPQPPALKASLFKTPSYSWGCWKDRNIVSLL
jgi:hypothetical protein